MHTTIHSTKSIPHAAKASISSTQASISESKSTVQSLIDLTDCAAEKTEISFLRKGKWANANVYLIKTATKSFVLKEFAAKNVFIRMTMGRLFIHREYTVLKKLEGISSVPQNVQRLTPEAIIMQYIHGENLAQMRTQRKKVPAEAFVALEADLSRMHQRNCIHLDLRNCANMVYGENGKIYLLDFQSYIKTNYFPKKIRIFLENIDFSGIYKAWNRVGSTPLDEARQEKLEQATQFRHLWVLKGYWLKKALSKKRNRRRS